MDICDLDYHLPRERIAQFPASKRDEARLLVLRRHAGDIRHARFQELTKWLRPRDLLVVNDTRVIAARLAGAKASGGKVEVLLCQPRGPDGGAVPPLEDAGAFGILTWSCLVRSRGRLQDGAVIHFGQGFSGVLSRPQEGGWSIRLQGMTDVRQLLDACGTVPLPPYVRRKASPLDRERYQTVFARREGSIAAPTAGLHFSEDVLKRLQEAGVGWAAVTLQVGPGTFLPLGAPRDGEHRVPEEYAEVGEECCRAWEATRKQGGRVIAVGTTTVRALESAVGDHGELRPLRGFTDLVIAPGYRFRAVDGLVTNFHLPRSTLLMLVMALAGRDRILEAYDQAVRRGYRFYSYGDAMFII
jgi:S-adenosylmethionine:tRNA ribosyltransferase-isomerase